MALLNGEVKAVVNDCMVTIRCVGFLDLTRIRFQTIIFSKRVGLLSLKTSRCPTRPYRINSISA